MSDDDKYDLIENYLSGNLATDQKSAFEKLLTRDTELARQIRLHKLSNELVIENRLRQVNTLLLNEKNKGGNNTTKFILGIALLVGIGAIAFIHITKKDSGKISVPSLVLSTQYYQETKSAENKVRTIASNNTVTSARNNTSTQQLTNPVKGNKIEEHSTIVEINDSATTETKNTEPIYDHPVEHKNTSMPSNICDLIKIEAKVTSYPSCDDQSSGSISITDIKGGTGPYAINVRNKSNEDVPAINIPSGIYSVLISDKKGCSKTISQVSVPEKLCEKEYTFNPFMDELLELPMRLQHGTLTVYERSGSLYFTKEFEPNSILQWNGYSKNGELNSGYFMFVISYKDGNEVKGGITIVR